VDPALAVLPDIELQPLAAMLLASNMSNRRGALIVSMTSSWLCFSCVKFV
jgi:hypothetical protein